MTIKAMIVDDEPFAREDLRHLLMQHPEIEIKWEAATMIEAHSLLIKHYPDLLFLDIELRGGSGFDLMASIDLHRTRVIVVTGFSRQSHKAEQYGAFDCLSKPVMAGSLARSLEKLQCTVKAMGEKKTFR